MFKLIIESYKNLAKSEKKFLLIATISVLILSSVAFFYGQIIQKEKFFTGYSLINGSDKMNYLAQLEDARQGSFLVHNFYTAEPQLGYFSPLWLALGRLAKLTGLNSLFTYHLFRIIFGFIFLVLSYLFITRIFINRRWRKITWLTLTLGSGLGVLTISGQWTMDNIFKNFGTDLWVVESNTFLSVSHSPLFIISQTCLLLFFWWVIEKIDKAKTIAVIGAGLFLLFLGFIHPMDLLIVYAVLVGWLIFKAIGAKNWPGPGLAKIITILAISFIAILYFFLLKHYDFAFANWSNQYITLSPKLFNYLMGYGLIFLAFVLGLYPTYRSKNPYLNFVLVWAVISWFLLYSPLAVQRKLGNGLQLPMVIVGAWGVWFLKEKLSYYKINFNKYFKFFLPWRDPAVAAIIIIPAAVLLLSTNLFLIGLELSVLKDRPLPYFWPREFKQTLEWLKDSSPRGSVILSSYKTGNIIPAYTARFSYIGYELQTVNYQKKRALTEKWFFGNNQDDWQKLLWLKQEGIDYVFLGPLEKVLGEFKPDTKFYLDRVFNRGEAEIYKVK